MRHPECCYQIPLSTVAKHIKWGLCQLWGLWGLICPFSVCTASLPALPKDPNWKGSVSFGLTVPCVTVNCRQSSFTRLEVPLGYQWCLIHICLLQSTEHCSVEVQGRLPQDMAQWYTDYSEMKLLKKQLVGKKDIKNTHFLLLRESKK